MSENNLVALAPTQSDHPSSRSLQTMIAFVKAAEDIDYVVIPGTGSKPTLLKLGLRNFWLFNVRSHVELVQSLVDFEKPLFHYHYRCWLYRNGRWSDREMTAATVWSRNTRSRSMGF